MKKYSIIFVLIWFAISYSCSKHESANQEYALAQNAALDDVALAEGNSLYDASEAKQTNSGEQANEIEHQSPAGQRKVIRNGQITVETTDLKKSKVTIDGIVKKYNAYYEGEQSTNNEYNADYQLQIRVPSASFDKFLVDIEKGGEKITSKSITAQDVSLQYYDLESRQKSKRKFLEHYQNLISKAKSVKETLEISEQIRQLQEDIESQESILQTLKDQISYSTLQISLSTKFDASPYSKSYLTKIKESVQQGWGWLLDLILFLIHLWPIIIVIALAVYFVQKRIKAKRNKH